MSQQVELVKKWQKARRDLAASEPVDVNKLAREWGEIVKAHFDPNQERDDHGRWSSMSGGEGPMGDTAGGAGGRPYGAADVRNTPWKDLSASEKEERMGELWLREKNTADNGHNDTRREQAQRRIERWGALRGQDLLNSVGSYHDALRSNFETRVNQASGKPGYGAGDNLGAAQAAQARAEEAARIQRENAQWNNNYGELKNASPDARAAALDAARRVSEEESSAAFHEELSGRTEGQSSGTLGTAGALLGAIARTAYVAHSIVGSLISAGDSWSKGDYISLGRSATYLRDDLQSLKGHFSTMSDEGKSLATKVFADASDTVEAISGWYKKKPTKAEKK